jgi:hypothetical protein
VKTTGCNDCHTPFYAVKAGDVPEKDWLTGDAVGASGPWGTSYPSNLRSSVHSMTEVQWISHAKSLRARPPMPWFSLNAMETEDLRAMYHFIRSLGDSTNIVPSALPPGKTPLTPYVNMSVVIPAKTSN